MTQTFSMVIQFDPIQVKFVCQGHRSNFKLTGGKWTIFWL